MHLWVEMLAIYIKIFKNVHNLRYIYIPFLGIYSRETFKDLY